MGESLNKVAIAFVLGLSLFMSGCVSVQGDLQPGSTTTDDDLRIAEDDTSSNVEEPTESNVEEPTEENQEVEIQAPAWNQSESLSDVKECRLPDPRPRSEQLLFRGQRQGGVLGRDPVGFTDWRRDGLLPITQELNIIFAKIAFDDAPPSRSISDGYLEAQAKKMTDLGHHWSQGAFTYKFQIVEDWVEVPANHADYPISAGDDVDHSAEAYALAEKNIEKVSQLIVENLPADLDFKAADIVVPVWSTNITEFTMPVTWRGGGLRDPNGQRTDLLFMGNSTYMHDSLEYTWSVIAHDFLHLQGLNEHAPGATFATHIGSMHRPSEFGWSAIMNSWETFLLNWFDESQIHCIRASEITETQEVMLTPLETFGGERKTIIIPTADYKALVVESRRPVGYSDTWPAEHSGLLVYEVDTDTDHLDHGPNQCSNSRENPKWSYYLLPDGAKEHLKCNNPEPYFMQPGETLTHSGVVIEMVHAGDEVDYVRITPSDKDELTPSGNARSNDLGSDQTFQATLIGSRKTYTNSHCSCCGCNALAAN